MKGEGDRQKMRYADILRGSPVVFGQRIAGQKGGREENEERSREKRLSASLLDRARSAGGSMRRETKREWAVATGPRDRCSETVVAVGVPPWQNERITAGTAAVTL
ncbi:hypothetical protein HAX54_037876 [Datura stramonium]|uniref:Uncharacterized protein n=1 Tax=Datura stramonium TaxID=4076 RepID=A0ABS8VIY5_DATST|nr:hypothetical protein [Datura stramonium]